MQLVGLLFSQFHKLDPIFFIVVVVSFFFLVYVILIFFSNIRMLQLILFSFWFFRILYAFFFVFFLFVRKTVVGVGLVALLALRTGDWSESSSDQIAAYQSERVR